MKKFDVVIFDLDGTLLDTLDDLTYSVNDALQRHGFPTRKREEIREFVGNGAERLIALSVPDGTGNIKSRDCLNDFRKSYSRNMRCKTAPYNGITALLTRLSDEGYKLAVVSNKYDAAVKELCHDFFGEYVLAAFGETGDFTRKPAPDIIIKVLSELQCAADKAVYIGDSEVDIKTAHNAGVAFVGVSWGFRNRETLLEAGAERIIDYPEELFKYLQQST